MAINVNCIEVVMLVYLYCHYKATQSLLFANRHQNCIHFLDKLKPCLLQYWQESEASANISDAISFSLFLNVLRSVGGVLHVLRKLTTWVGPIPAWMTRGKKKGRARHRTQLFIKHYNSAWLKIITPGLVLLLT